MLESWSGSGLNSPVPACIHTCSPLMRKNGRNRQELNKGQHCMCILVRLFTKAWRLYSRTSWRGARTVAALTKLGGNKLWDWEVRVGWVTMLKQCRSILQGTRTKGTHTYVWEQVGDQSACIHGILQHCNSTSNPRSKHCFDWPFHEVQRPVGTGQGGKTKQKDLQKL